MPLLPPLPPGRKLLPFILILNILKLTFPKLTAAQIVINEFQPDPEGDDTGEWIELYNTGSSTINLEGYVLSDLLASPNYYTLPPAEINPKGYAVFYHDQTGLQLNNGGDRLQLFNSQNQLLDTRDYAKAIAGQSFGRNPDGVGDWQWFDTPTPNGPNPGTNHPTGIPSANPHPENVLQLRLSEVYPCPLSGENEWLELEYQSHSQASLSGWQIKDSSNNTVNLTTELSGAGYYQVNLNRPILNNSGDTISLVNSEGKAVDSMTYADCTIGIGWALINQTWSQTTTLTPGAANSYSPPPAPSPMITKKSNHTIKPSPPTTTSPATQLSSTTPTKIIKSAINADDFTKPKVSLRPLVASVAGITNLSTQSATASNSSQFISPPSTKKSPINLMLLGAATLTLAATPLASRHLKRFKLK